MGNRGLPRPAVPDTMHDNVVDPDMHSTDTGGVTGPVFAGMHLLNVFFAPRIKDIDTRQRYALVRPKEYAAKGYQIASSCDN